MRLARVSLTGFKTFARRTEIPLEAGITAIVGPNGSGKSNIVDAIRWALGETHARELRGLRMEEVIFAGGQGRPRMGFAEVELVLDNQAGFLPLEDSEVCVTRRITRSGDSEYRVNGQRARLRDLERLLEPTGLTQSGYAIVAQHDIEAIIQATPSQRRALIEQAAGVRAARASREEALDRVNRADQVRERIHDLLSEARPRLEDLASQAEAAHEQRKLTSRLAELRGSLAREEWRAARGRLRLARRRLDAALSRAEAAAEAEAAYAVRLDAQRSVVEDARARRRDAALRLEASRLLAERASGEVRLWRDRQMSAVLAAASARADYELARGERAAAQAVIDRLTGASSPGSGLPPALEERLSRARAEQESLLGAFASAERRRIEAEAKLASEREAMVAATAAEREAATRLELLTAALFGDRTFGAVARAIAAGTLPGRRLADCYEVRDPSDALAITAALEAHLGAWVVDDIAAAAALFEADGVREEIVSTGKEAEPEPGDQFGKVAGTRRASEAITSREEVRAALQGFLENAWLADDGKAAAEIVEQAGGTAVLPDGTVITPVGIRGGGNPGEIAARDAALLQERAAMRDEARAALAAAQESRERVAARGHVAEEAASAARRDLEERRSLLDEVGAVLRATEAELLEARSAAEEQHRRLEAAQQAAATSAERMWRAELRLCAAEGDALVALARSRTATGRARVAGDEVWSSTGEVESLAPALADSERSLAAIEAERADVAIAAARASDECDAARREVAAAETAVAQFAEVVRGDESDEGPEPDAAAAEQAEREIVRLERRIGAMGPVNALAPEQHAELQSRVAVMEAGHDDLASAFSDIRALCAQLGVQIERRFDSVYGAVGEHFQELFAELFPGGNASLALEEVTPPAAADDGPAPVPALPGVGIIARPAGKRAQTLNVLSGGERALTALAFILALQRVTPSPFYVFDEVDAPLDDSNVKRFASLLTRLGEEQQFVVVTHNHITMTVAQSLHGVTIDNAGVSQVISLRLTDEGLRPGSPMVAVPDQAAMAAG